MSSTSTFTNSSTDADVATNFAGEDFNTCLTILNQWMEDGYPADDQATSTPAALAGEPPLFWSPANAATSTSSHVASSPASDNSQLSSSFAVDDIIKATGKPRQRPYQARQKGLKRGERSCEKCKVAKRKCHPIPGGHGCQRCAKAGEACVYDDHFHAHGRQRKVMEECAAAGVVYTTTRQKRTMQREARAVRLVGGSPTTSSANSGSPNTDSIPSSPPSSDPSTSSVESVNSADWQLGGQGMIGSEQGVYTGEFEMGGLFDFTQPLDSFFPTFEPFAPVYNTILVDNSFGGAELAYPTGDFDIDDFLVEEEATQVAPVEAPELAFFPSYEQQEVEVPRELTDEEVLAIEQDCLLMELMDMVYPAV
ncbi:hypothetical protein IAT38_005251 [Cryptococcus sp. DSM 104549]